MKDETAHLEYIGSMADQLAEIAKGLDRGELAALLRQAADLADREWLISAAADQGPSPPEA